MENATDTNAKADFRGIRILCITLILGIVAFSIITLVMAGIGSLPAQEQFSGGGFADILLLVVAAVALICLFLATRNYNRSILLIRNKFTLAEKLTDYRTILLRYMALCEFPGLFSIICFVMTGNYYMFIITTIVLLVMAWKFPGLKKATEELNLDMKEQQELL